MYVELRFLKGPMAGRKVAVEPGRPFVLGRSAVVDVAIQDAGLSRRHCAFRIEGNALLLRDLGSKNGTFVNGKRLAGECRLKGGDKIVLGKSLIQVFSDADYLDEEKQCLVCGRRISLETFVDREVRQEAEDRFICPDCAGSVLTPHISGFEIEEVVASGALGVIYRARQTSMDRRVALKVLRQELTRSPEQVARFYREAEVAASLSHPNIVQIYHAGEADGACYIVMEYVDGSTLLKQIEEAPEGRLPVPFVVSIGLHLCDALDHAYQAGVVHRDIKPSNVLVTTLGIPKLVDFGLAKNFHEAGSSGVTAVGQGLGTLAYLPPEQLDEAVYADQRADIYGLGATLYHALTGRPPFQGATRREFVGRILSEKPEPVAARNPEVSRAISDVIDRCLAKDPAERYQTPLELKEALRKAVEVEVACVGCGRRVVRRVYSNVPKKGSFTCPACQRSKGQAPAGLPRREA